MQVLQAPASWPGLRLWLLDLRTEPDAQAWSACQPEEHARALRFRFEQHAQRYRAAHAKMRQAMATHLGLSPAQWQWVAGLHGKPHMADPRWGHFNLSHSEDWALLAWHPHQPVGVDIEWCKPLPDLLALAERQFTVPELRWLHQARAEPERTTRFYRLWSAKEAALKALGSGLLVAAARVEVDLRHTLPVDERVGPAQSTFIDLRPEDGRAEGGRCRMSLGEIHLPHGLQACACVALVSVLDQSLCW